MFFHAPLPSLASPLTSLKASLMALPAAATSATCQCQDSVSEARTSSIHVVRHRFDLGQKNDKVTAETEDKVQICTNNHMIMEKCRE